MTNESKIDELMIWESLKNGTIKELLRNREDGEFWWARKKAHSIKQNYFYVSIEVAHRYKEYVYMHPERTFSELENIFENDKYGRVLRAILHEDNIDNLIWDTVKPKKNEAYEA